MLRRLFLHAFIGLCLWASLSPVSVKAKGTENPTSFLESSEFSAGLGWIFLPLSDVCASGGCESGDSSPLLQLTGLYHPHPLFALGAGAQLGLFPTTIPPLAQSGESTSRGLARSYLILEAEARYFPGRKVAAPRYQPQFWVGPALGFAVLSDRYRSVSSNPNGPIRIGGPGATLHSLGLSARAQVGLDYALFQHFKLGATAGVGLLLFPNQAAQTVLGDTATLAGAHLTAQGAIHAKFHFSP